MGDQVQDETEERGQEPEQRPDTGWQTPGRTAESPPVVLGEPVAQRGEDHLENNDGDPLAGRELRHFQSAYAGPSVMTALSAPCRSLVGPLRTAADAPRRRPTSSSWRPPPGTAVRGSGSGTGSAAGHLATRGPHPKWCRARRPPHRDSDRRR